MKSIRRQNVRVVILNLKIKKNRSVTSMIQQRELGLAFSNSEKCRIGNIFLPNYMTRVAQYDSRAFCGSYSADGKLLVTASQGIK